MLAKVGARDIQKLYEGLSESGLSRSTLTYVHTLLKSAFTPAQRRRKIAFSPMDGVDSPGGKRMGEEQLENRESRVMTPAQVAQFLAAAEKTRFAPIFTLAFHTGCRPGELLGLRGDAFDANAQTPRILTWT